MYGDYFKHEKQNEGNIKKTSEVVIYTKMC